MPASRRLTLLLALLGLPDLAAAAAPRANAPAATSARPARVAEAGTAPVSRASRVPAPGDRSHTARTARAADPAAPVPQTSARAAAVRPPRADATASPAPKDSRSARADTPASPAPKDSRSARADAIASPASKDSRSARADAIASPASKDSRSARAADSATTPKDTRSAGTGAPPPGWVHPSRRAAKPAPKASPAASTPRADEPATAHPPGWVHPSRRAAAENQPVPKTSRTRTPRSAAGSEAPATARAADAPASPRPQPPALDTRAEAGAAPKPPDPAAIERPVPKTSPADAPEAASPRASQPAEQPAPEAGPAASDPRTTQPAGQPAPKASPAGSRARPTAERPDHEADAADATPPRAGQPAPEASPAERADRAVEPIAPGTDAAEPRVPRASATADAPRSAEPPVPKASPEPAEPPVPKASPKSAARSAAPASVLATPTRATRPGKPGRLRPRQEPLLARHPAASCALDPLEAVAQRQHERTRASLREFYWSDMARFFETTFDESEPTPRQADDAAFLPSADVLAGLPATARAPLTALAGARVVDRLSEKAWIKHNKLLSSLSPADVAALLRADSPTLRAHVWTWLATTRTGGCHLGHVDLDFIEAAVADRSIAVEHGEDLVYRSLGDYALEARARLANLDPARFDAFLVRLTGAAEVDPLVRATAHGVLLRRAHWDTLELGLRDPSPPVRAATAAAAAEMNTAKLEARLVEHAAGDPADLVTELIVGSLLGVYDPHNHGKPQLRGLLATTRDERLTAALDRWRGRGDALAPLPVPARPLKFAAGPVPTDSPAEPVPTDSRPATPQAISGASPAAAAAIHAANPSPAAPAARAPEPRERPLPGVRDDEPLKMPPVRP